MMSRQQEMGAHAEGADKSGTRQRPQIVTLLIVPALLLALTIYEYHVAGGFEADPDYSYLLNAVTILHLHPPEQYNHPGTPVQTLGAVVIGLIWLVRALFVGQSARVDVVLHPELYLFVIDMTIISLVAAATFALGYRLWRRSGRLAVGFVAQAALFLSPIVSSFALARVAPEAALLFSTLLLAATLVPFIFNEEADHSWRRHAWVGVAIGLSLAIKVTSLPLAIAVFYLKGLRGQRIAIIASALSFVFFTLPIIRQYFHIYRMYFGYATHTGLWGEGSTGLPSSTEILINLRLMLSTVPEMFACLGISIAVALFGGAALSRPGMPSRRFFLVSAAILAAQIVLVAKSFAAHYLIPSVAIDCLIVAAIMRLTLFSNGWARHATTATVAILLIVGWERGVMATRDWLDVQSTARAGDGGGGKSGRVRLCGHLLL
jgi:hypothetical protein